MNKNICNNSSDSSDFSIDDIILSDEDDYLDVSDSELIEKYQNYILKQSQEDESHRTWEREDEGITSHNPKDFVVESAPDKEINPDKSKTSQFMGAESKEGGTSNTKKTDIAEVPLDIKGMEGFAPAPHLSKGEVESMCVHLAANVSKIAKMDVGQMRAEDWLYERCEEDATYCLRFLFPKCSTRDILNQLRRKMCEELERVGA